MESEKSAEQQLSIYVVDFPKEKYISRKPFFFFVQPPADSSPTHKPLAFWSRDTLTSFPNGDPPRPPSLFFCDLERTTCEEKQGGGGR